MEEMDTVQTIKIEKVITPDMYKQIYYNPNRMKQPKKEFMLVNLLSPIKSKRTLKYPLTAGHQPELPMH